MSDVQVLYVDDEEHLRIAASQTFDLAGISAQCVENAAAAIAVLEAGFAGVVVTDLRMPGMDGIGLLRKALEIDADLPVILLTGYGDVELAVGCIKDGAYDFLEKPCEPARLVACVERALEKRHLSSENKALKDQLGSTNLIEARLLGRSAAMRAVRDNLAAIADLSRSIETSLAFELDEVTTQIDNALANYEIKTIARRALLKEQAAIARQLGNANGAAIASGSSGINVAVEQKQPLYIRGYKALEKEIALIDARGKGTAAYPYIENYVALASRKRALESDKRLQRIETGLAQTPLADSERFAAANYDLETVVFEGTGSKRLVVILATLMGGLIAVIFVLIRSAMLARQEQNAA